MSNVRISDIKLKGGGDSGDSKARAADAEKRKASANETIEEAWARIKQTKSYENDKSKLDVVEQAMADGEIGREPVEEGKKQKKFSAAEAKRLYNVLMERKKEETLRKMVDETPRNYRNVTKKSQFKVFMNSLREEPIIAVDTETTGVDVYTDIIVGMSLTLPRIDAHVYIPFEHDEGEQLDRDYVLSKLKPILYDPGVGKVLHNAIFDIAMFRRHGSDLRGVVWDTMTAMHLLNENEDSFKLKDLATKWLGVESDTFGQLFGKTPFNEIPLDVALVYAAKDTDLTWRLYEFQRKAMEQLPTIKTYYEQVEVPILYVIVDMEANGYVLDLDYAKEYGEKLHRKADELREWIVGKLAPHHEGDEEINLNAPGQVKDAMSKAIGKDLPNMNAKQTLKPIRSKYELVDKYLEFKEVTKLSGTYIDTLPTKQNPTTKRWHSRFNPMGTVTGRFSSGKDEEDTTGQGFNVQNQPQEARPMFIAPDGKVLVSADFKAQEIRCVAYLSQEPVLIEAFRTGRDPYAMMASTYYKCPYEDVYKTADGDDTPERKQFKVVWLATLYGMSDKSLAEMLGTNKEDATKLKEDIFGEMPALQKWLENNENFVKRNGYVWADNKSRKRRLPDAKNKKQFIPWGKYRDDKYKDKRIHNAKIGSALRQATNARVQGSSSIQTKVTMILMHERFKGRKGWKIWATVHDEVIVELPEEDLTQEAADEIRSLMVDSYPWGDDEVPNGTDLEIGKRWGEFVAEKEWFTA